MRLIDVDTFIKELQEWNTKLQTHTIIYAIPGVDRQLGVNDAITIARQMHTVDAEPVIRCWHCKHFDTETMHKGYGFCPMLDTFRRPEGYCDLAERK